MRKFFQIGAFRFLMESEEEISVPDNFLKFEIEISEGILKLPAKESNVSDSSIYTYRLYLVDELDANIGKVITKRQDLVVFETDGGEGRMLGINGIPEPYACIKEVSSMETEVSILRNQTYDFSLDTLFTSLFSLERRMIGLNSMILHCAYLNHEDRAILFSAPSGVGKSTQAGLWEKYRGSHTVNGDRARLYKKDDCWTAGSWPVCGSSEICNLEDLPIAAIVMLRQGKVNEVKRLSGMQAFKELFAQITTNRWNGEFVQKVIAQVEDLVRSVPVYCLTCDISEEAVAVLEAALR